MRFKTIKEYCDYINIDADEYIRIQKRQWLDDWVNDGMPRPADEYYKKKEIHTLKMLNHGAPD